MLGGWVRPTASSKSFGRDAAFAGVLHKEYESFTKRIDRR